MPNGFVNVTTLDNNVVAVPRVDTKFMGLNDYFSDNAPLVVRQAISEVSPYYNWRDVLAMLETSKRVSTTKDLEVRSFEQGPMFRPVKIGAIVGSGTASEVVVTLTADSFLDTESLGGTVARTSLMKDDLIRFRNGATGIVRIKAGSGATTQFTLRGVTGSSENITQAVQDHITSGTPLFVYSNAFGEGTYAPTEGLEQSTTQWRNQAQIIKTHRAATGDANAVEIIDWTGKNRYYFKQEVEMGAEHRIKELLAIWFGSGGFTMNEANEPVRMCLGVDTAIDKMGNEYRYTVGTFSLADLDLIVAQIDAVNGGNVYDFYAGSALFRAVQKVFNQAIGATGQTGIDYSNFGDGDPKQKMVDLGVMAIVYGGITFRLIQTDMLSLPELTGINGYNFPNDGYLIPSKRQSVDVSENGRKNKISVNTLEVKYTTEFDGSIRRYKFDPFPRAITGRDQTALELLTQVVPQITNTRKMIKIKALAA
ncbi:hypothetical protein [Hymenobacter metallicola]|uniref:Uncharacterized protein n=1 Tax=Hymenobacter metallicola TaxID=2563114 RepID=A0A4Z0QJE3_9BACT|nr:hypothetical protein [Hymenobacter metallicola]TGE29815.1 hypothetical protein E5K02_10250 [Hymenobacter metallicola]